MRMTAPSDAPAPIPAILMICPFQECAILAAAGCDGCRCRCLSAKDFQSGVAPALVRTAPAATRSST
jgi:hypothetical protein